jgi:DNA-binding transcriptional LysR family regulator
MDTRRLQHFVAVADHGGFTAAAKAVFVSQPALSLAVKELETELGTDLFVRLGRKVRLTAAGEALLGPARQVLRDIETGQAAVAAVTGLRAGRLTLASLPTLAADPVSRLVGNFRRDHPQVRVDLAAPEDGAELFDLVQNGQCELGVTDAFDVPPELETHALGTQALSLVLPPGAVEPEGATVSLAALADMAFVAAPAGTSTRRLLDESLAAAGHAPRLAVVTAQRDAILPLVLAGAGAALVPAALAEVASRLGARAVQPVPPVARELVLVRRSGPRSPAAAEFCDAAVRTLAPSGRRRMRT